MSEYKRLFMVMYGRHKFDIGFLFLGKNIDVVVKRLEGKYQSNKELPRRVEEIIQNKLKDYFDYSGQIKYN